MMFLLNLGYRWNLPSALNNLEGVIVLPSHNNSARVLREPPGHDLRRVLFDPQIYMSTINQVGRLKICGRLATYPWFDVPGINDFESGSMRRTEWEAEVRSHVELEWPGAPPADVEKTAIQAVDFQTQIGTTHILLPSPLIDEREDEGETAGIWLDAGIEAAAELDVTLPILAKRGSLRAWWSYRRHRRSHHRAVEID
jgi:hypothetical protein